MSVANSCRRFRLSALLFMLASAPLAATVSAGPVSSAPARSARTLSFEGPFRRIHHPSWYPRVAELADGRLLCGIEQVLPGARGIGVIESKDGGKSWEGITPILQDANPVDLANVFPLQLRNGDVVAAYRHHSPKEGVFRLRLAASPDGREKWNVRSTIVEGRGGLWEPFLLQLPDGQLQAYYASEVGVAPAQLIEMVSSQDDGATWSAPVTVAQHERSRDGMPAVVQLGPDELYAVFEAQDVAGARFAIRGVRSLDRGATWSQERELIYRPENDEGTGWAAGAPHIVRLDESALLVSFQTDEDVLFEKGGKDSDPRHREYDYLKHCSLKYVSSTDEGRSWSNAVLLDGGPDRTTVWSALHALRDGTLLVLSGTQDTVWCRRAKSR